MHSFNLYGILNQNEVHMNNEKYIAHTLIEYYQHNRRELPWRLTKDPYKIWVSEIMLQQTRVEAVKGYYARFLKELPTLHALAMVDEDYLMKLWEGLGYYSRVRNMRKCAIEVQEKWNGEMPKTASDLLTLPGIGKYTSAAIASICYNESIAALDGNGLRVFARLYGIEENVLDPKVESMIREKMQKCVEHTVAADFNQAVMDLASSICTPKASAKCEQCPLSNVCQAYKDNRVAELPVRITKSSKKIEEYTVLVFRKDHSILLEKRSNKGLLASLYGLPMVEGYLTKEELHTHLHNDTCKIQEIGNFQHIFTHKIWNMKAYLIENYDLTIEDPIWAKEEELMYVYALPSAFSKIVKEVYMK